MSQLMDTLYTVTFFDIPLITLITWAAAGAVAGLLLMGRRPIGLLGDIVIGVLGGFLGGWARVRVPNFIAGLVENTSPETAAQIRNFHFRDQIGGVSPEIAEHVGNFIIALLGAMVVLALLRSVMRKS